MGYYLHPVGEERPPADDRDVSPPVGASAPDALRAYDGREKSTNRSNETMYKATTLITLLVLTSACSPLRRTQTATHEQTTVNDTTLTEMIRCELEQRLSTLRQTIVEYYPPLEHPVPDDERMPRSPDTLPAVLSPQKIPMANPLRQPVRRIIHTEASVRNDRATIVDSISHSRINIAARQETQTQVEEQPSNGAVWLRWATALAGMLLLILLILKLR